MPWSLSYKSLQACMMKSTLNETLIAAVQRRPALYDKTEYSYSDRGYINKLWREIGEELGINENVARRKWTTLRDYFQKTHKRLLTIKTLSGGERKKKWHLYDNMLFLLPHIAGRRSCSNLSDRSLIGEDDGLTQMLINSEIAVVDSPEATDTYPPVSNPRTLPGNEQSSITPEQCNRWRSSASRTFNAKRRKARSPQDRLTKDVSLRDILEAIKNMNAKDTPKDEDQLFLDSLAPKLRNLDPVTKLECQAELQMVLLRYMRCSLSPGPAQTSQTNTFSREQGPTVASHHSQNTSYYLRHYASPQPYDLYHTMSY